MQHRWFTEDNHTGYTNAPGDFYPVDQSITTIATEEDMLFPDASSWSSPHRTLNQYDVYLVALGSHVHFVVADAAQFQSKPRHCVLRCPASVLPCPVVASSTLMHQGAGTFSSASIAVLDVFVVCATGALLRVAVTITRQHLSEVPGVSLEVLLRHSLQVKDTTRVYYLATRENTDDRVLHLHAEGGHITQLIVNERKGVKEHSLSSAGGAVSRSWLPFLSSNSQRQVLASVTMSSLLKSYIVSLSEPLTLSLHSVTGMSGPALFELTLPGEVRTKATLQIVIAGGGVEYVAVSGGAATHFVQIVGDGAGGGVSLDVVASLSLPHHTKFRVLGFASSRSSDESMSHFAALCQVAEPGAKSLAGALCVLNPQGTSQPRFYQLSSITDRGATLEALIVCSDEHGDVPVGLTATGYGQLCVWFKNDVKMTLSSVCVNVTPSSLFDSLSRCGIVTAVHGHDPVDPYTPRLPISPHQLPLFLPQSSGPRTHHSTSQTLQKLVSFTVASTGAQWSLADLLTAGPNSSKVLLTTVRRCIMGAVARSHTIAAIDVVAALDEWRAMLQGPVTAYDICVPGMPLSTAVESGVTSYFTLRACQAVLYAGCIHLLEYLGVVVPEGHVQASSVLLPWHLGLCAALTTGGHAEMLARSAHADVESLVRELSSLLPGANIGGKHTVASVARRLDVGPSCRALHAWLRAWGHRPELCHFVGLLHLQIPHGSHPFAAIEGFQAAATYIDSLPTPEEKLSALESYLVAEDHRRITSAVQGGPAIAGQLYRQYVLVHVIKDGRLLVPSAALAPLMSEILSGPKAEGDLPGVVQRVWIAYVRQLIEDSDIAAAHNQITRRPDGVCPETTVAITLMQHLTRACLHNQHVSGHNIIRSFVLGGATNPIRPAAANSMDNELLIAVCSEIFHYGRRHCQPSSHRGNPASFCEVTQLLLALLTGSGHYGVAARVACEASDSLRTNGYLAHALDLLVYSADALEAMPLSASNLIVGDPIDSAAEEAGTNFDFAACFSSESSRSFRDSEETKFSDLKPMNKTLLPEVRRKFLHIHAILKLNLHSPPSVIWESAEDETESVRHTVEQLIQAQYWDMAARLLYHYDMDPRHLVEACAEFTALTLSVAPAWPSLCDLLVTLTSLRKEEAPGLYDAAIQTLLAVDTSICIDEELFSHYAALAPTNLVGTMLAKSQGKQRVLNASLLRAGLNVCRQYLCGGGKVGPKVGPVILDAVTSLCEAIASSSIQQRDVVRLADDVKRGFAELFRRK